MIQLITGKELDIQGFYNDGPGAYNNKIFNMGDSPQAKILLKRAEKLRMALLILAKTLDQEEKKDLIELANQFIYLGVDFLTSRHPQRQELKKLQATLLKIAEFLDFLVLNEFLNTSNAVLLKDAIINFAHLANDYQKESGKKNLSFKEEDFSPIAIKDILKSDIKDISHKGHLKDNDIKDISEKGQREPEKGKPSKASMKLAGGSKDGANLELKPRSLKVEAKIQSRRMQIIELLKMEDALTASEIRSKLKNTWSQKTVQRELMSLLEDGILKKEGEKRWTRYSIKI